MNRSISYKAICVLAVLLSGCTAPAGPVITPPQPVFVANSIPPDPTDHGIYADVGSLNAIDIEWMPDSTGNTTGYLLYRSGDSSVGSDGLLAHRTTIADLESSNLLVEPLPTSFQDTLGVAPGATYYYQLQAFYRSPTNSLTYSHPTHVNLSTSFTFAQRVLLLSPTSTVTLHGSPLELTWQDPNSNGGSYQIIIQRLDSQDYVWSYIDNDGFGNPVAIQYPMNATPLLPGIPYQWRVKWIEPFGGSTSSWTAFSVEP